jgi:hypothetical protein
VVEYGGLEVGVALPPLGERRIEPPGRDDVDGDAAGARSRARAFAMPTRPAFDAL